MKYFSNINNNNDVKILNNEFAKELSFLFEKERDLRKYTIIINLSRIDKKCRNLESRFAVTFIAL